MKTNKRTKSNLFSFVVQRDPSEIHLTTNLDKSQVTNQKSYKELEETLSTKPMMHGSAGD